MPFAFARAAVAEGGEHRAPRLFAEFDRVGRTDRVRELRRDNRRDGVDAELLARVVMRELAAGRVIGGPREEREHHFVGREPDAEREPQIAVVRAQDIAAAFEGHRRAGQHQVGAIAADAGLVRAAFDVHAQQSLRGRLAVRVRHPQPIDARAVIAGQIQMDSGQACDRPGGADQMRPALSE